MIRMAQREQVGGTEVGIVTSGTMSPMLERGIAMGYVPLPKADPGSTVDIVIRNQAIPATVVKLPFIEKG